MGSVWPLPADWAGVGLLAPWKDTAGFMGDPKWGLLCAQNSGFPQIRTISQRVPASCKQARVRPSEQLCPPASQSEGGGSLSEGLGGLGEPGCLGNVRSHTEGLGRGLQFRCT